MEIDKLFENNSIDNVADNIFGVVNNSVSEVREMQRKKVAENVQLVVNALKKIEEDIREKYDSVSNNLEKRIISIKNGRDGIDGKDGRDGKDGKNGKDGKPGRDGKNGLPGKDGADGKDGVSVSSAYVDFDGSLIILLDSGKEINVGEVIAPDLAEKIKVITNGGGTSQSVLDTLTNLQSQIDALSGATIYKGLWNASTNSPSLTSSVGTSGNFYIVSVAGSTNLNGITNWGVGDWAIFNGSVWQRVEGGAAGNFTTVSASSLTSGRVTYAGTGGLLQDSSNLTFNGTTLTSAGFSGPLNGTVGATTPNTGSFTTLSSTGNFTVNTDRVVLTASAPANSLYVNGSGNLGLGTASPLTKLHLQDNSAVFIQMTDGGDGASRVGQNGTALTFGVDGANGSTERMRIDSSGNVGIGTSSPSTKLHLQDNSAVFIQMTDGGDGASRVGQNGTALTFGVDGANGVTERMRIDSSGNVLLGGTATPASATASLAIFNGTAPTGSVADGIVLYAQDVSSSSELKVRDEAGNVTTLSPHNFSLIPEGPSEDMAWAYYSEKGGKRINVDMLKLARMVEKLTGEKLVYEG